MDGVAFHAHQLGLDQGRAFAAMRALHGFIRRVIDLAGIGAVNDHAGHAVADGAVGQIFYVDLVFGGRGVSPEIAFDNQHQAELAHRGKVDAFIAHAGGLSAIADPGKAGELFALKARAQRDAGHHRQQIAQHGDGRDHVALLDVAIVRGAVFAFCRPVMAGVSLGARLQGKELACLTWIGDGGQSTGVSYEGINFAAVRKLGLVLIIESNLWAYSTPTEYQVNVKDLANRAIGYGMPGLIIDGTDACQVYDATYEAVERAHRGEGPTLIEAKLMRMKGHAIHDAAAYVPKEMHEFWRKRDCIDRFQKYLLEKKWLTPAQDKEMIAAIEKEIDAEREFAENSPMPEGHTAAEGVFCENGCHEIKPKYGMPQKARRSEGKLKESEAAIHFK